MARGVNKAIIVGNLGKDPETRYTAGGSAITNITVATSESWKDKQTGEQHERTEWHRVVAFHRLAEIMGEYLRKGSQVYIEGKIQTRKWQGQDGQDRYTTEIVASEMQMLGSRRDSDNNQQYSGGQAGGGFRAPAAPQPPAAAAAPSQPAAPAPAQPPATAPGDDFTDDDIPF